MNPKSLCLLVFLLISVLCACGIQGGQSSGEVSDFSSGAASSVYWEEPSSSTEDVVSESSGEETEVSSREESRTDPSKVVYPFEPYAVEMLTDTQRRLYDEMLAKILNMEDFSYPIASSPDEDLLWDITAAWDALKLDMPQIKNYFWLDDIFDSEGTLATGT